MNNVILSRQQLIDTKGHCDLTQPEMKTIGAFVLQNERIDPNAKYLEIGVFGGGTIHFLKSITKTTNFVGIDMFEDYLPSSTNTHCPGTYRRDDVQEFLGDRVNLIKGDSNFVLPGMREKFDFIFIDGNHKYPATVADFRNAAPLLKDGGQIGFHNCSTHMSPDFDLYAKDDGGPWLLTQELIMSNEWVLVESADRLKVFKKR